MNPRVCIIQPVMKGYRLPFLVGLDKRLSQVGITIQVVYGTPWPEEAKRGDHEDLPRACQQEPYELFSGCAAG